MQRLLVYEVDLRCAHMAGAMRLAVLRTHACTMHGSLLNGLRDSMKGRREEPVELNQAVRSSSLYWAIYGVVIGPRWVAKGRKRRLTLAAASRPYRPWAGRYCLSERRYASSRPSGMGTGVAVARGAAKPLASNGRCIDHRCPCQLRRCRFEDLEGRLRCGVFYRREIPCAL
jgi:hypothetical protein